MEVRNIPVERLRFNMCVVGYETFPNPTAQPTFAKCDPMWVVGVEQLFNGDWLITGLAKAEEQLVVTPHSYLVIRRQKHGLYYHDRVDELEAAYRKHLAAAGQSVEEDYIAILMRRVRSGMSKIKLPPALRAALTEVCGTSDPKAFIPWLKS